MYRLQRKGRTKQIISPNKERKRNEEAFSHGSECGVLLYGNGGKWRLRGQAALFWVLAPFLFSAPVFLTQFELSNLGRRRLNFGPLTTTVRGYLNLMKDYGLGSEIIMCFHFVALTRLRGVRLGHLSKSLLFSWFLIKLVLEDHVQNSDIPVPTLSVFKKIIKKKLELDKIILVYF